MKAPGGGEVVVVEVQLSFTIAPDGGRVDGQHHAPAALPPGMTQYPLYRTLGGPKSR